jgi:hypothetical protein
VSFLRGQRTQISEARKSTTVGPSFLKLTRLIPWALLTDPTRHVRAHHIDKDKDDPLLRDVLSQGLESLSRGRRGRHGAVGDVIVESDDLALESAARQKLAEPSETDTLNATLHSDLERNPTEFSFVSSNQWIVATEPAKQAPEKEPQNNQPPGSVIGTGRRKVGLRLQPPS